METSALAAAMSPFFKVVGETLAEVKKQEIATIDIELLQLKKARLEEEHLEVQSRLSGAVAQQKAEAHQDLIDRGLANTTVLDGKMSSIESEGNALMEKASREYNRAIEELALTERRVREQARPWWKRLLNLLGFSRPRQKSAGTSD